MKLLIGSDYHCQPELMLAALQQIPEVDGYINCGDFCTWAGAKPEAQLVGYDPRGEAEVAQWIDFFQAVDQLGKPWLFVPGNHDPSASYFEQHAPQFSHGVLATASATLSFLGLRLLVVPYTPPCGWNWPLTRTHVQELLTTFSDTPVDILVTHAPPKGALDEEGKWYHRKTPTLRPLVDALAPRFYLCGHMHLDGGKTMVEGATTFVNAALHNMILEFDPSL